MTFVTLINSEVLNCSSDKIVITKDEVRCLNDIHILLSDIEILKNIEQKNKLVAEKNGLQAGYSEGLKLSQIEAKSEFEAYLAKISYEINEKISVQRNTIIDLAIEITKKVVACIDSDEVVTGIASKAVTQFKKQDSVKIQVHTELAENIKTKLREKCSSSGAESYPNIEVIQNPNLDVLDCIISSEYGVIDASFNEQIKRLKHHLVQSLEISS